jgi:hypothetical protein
VVAVSFPAGGRGRGLGDVSVFAVKILIFSG